MTDLQGAPRPTAEPAVPAEASAAVELPATPESVPMIRRLVLAIAAAHGAEGMDLGDIALVVTEAVDNVVLHAYDPGEEGRVRVWASVADGVLTLVVADEGHGVRPSASTGLGLGLGLIAGLAADVAITGREPHGTELTITIPLGAARRERPPFQSAW